jgi:uncharacterized SAM-binding protein YcdF (DUF218 family)
VFWLKKVVSFWLMPVPLCAVLLGAGLLLAGPARRTRAGRTLLALAALLFLLFSDRAVSLLLLAPLEARFPAVPEAARGGGAPPAIAGCRFVVVLGGGHTDLAALPALGQLSTSALARLAEGVRLLRLLPDARLIVSGPGDAGRPTHAAVLARAAESLGVDPGRIMLIDTARDTEDESHEVARRVGGARVALVTSAWHMPRAAALFRRAGVDFVACPADFVARGATGFRWMDFAWDSESLERSTLAVHERLGLLWLRLRGLG